MSHIEFDCLNINIKQGGEDHMAGCSQPVANMGMSQGTGVSCNGDKDESTTAYCQDKDVSASSATKNVSCCKNSQLLVKSYLNFVVMNLK